MPAFYRRWHSDAMDSFATRLAEAQKDAAQLRAAIVQVVLGQAEVIEQVLWGV
jgi:hypothetical protein